MTLLKLSDDEARALRELIESASAPQIESVRDKLARALALDAPTVIPGQITIDEQLREAA